MQTICPICDTPVEHLSVCEQGHTLSDMRAALKLQRDADRRLLSSYGLSHVDELTHTDLYPGHKVAALIRRLTKETP